MPSLYYDMDGNPVTIQEWSVIFEDHDARKVGDDTIEDGAEDVRVSTVLLGLDHSWGKGPPLIFETMIFGGPHDNFCTRYATKQQALDGHEAVVLALEAGNFNEIILEVDEDDYEDIYN